MNWFERIFQRLNGLHYRQEYLCLDGESFQYPIYAWLVHEGLTVSDITTHHLFVGYHPLIFALTSSPGMDAIEIYFTDKILHPNERILRKDAIARLSLQRIREQPVDNGSILYFEGITGTHRFLPPFRQWIIRANNRFFNKKKGNVFLPGNLYTQVQVAYSFPRNISLITLMESGLYNLFPTDLHGQANELYYIISLRREGKACQQVIKCRKILISRVESQFYKTVYSLGKNHMQEPKEKSLFPFSEKVSGWWQLPIPERTISYLELELQDSFDHGIHRLLLFKIISAGSVQGNAPALTHIHNVYATWRHNKHLPGNYLLR